MMYSATRTIIIGVDGRNGWIGSVDHAPSRNSVYRAVSNAAYPARTMG
jgi:hypothetical protein